MNDGRTALLCRLLLWIVSRGVVGAVLIFLAPLLLERGVAITRTGRAVNDAAWSVRDWARMQDELLRRGLPMYTPVPWKKRITDEEVLDAMRLRASEWRMDE